MEHGGDWMDQMKLQVSHCREMKSDVDTIRGMGDKLLPFFDPNISREALAKRFTSEFSSAEKAARNFLRLANEINLLQVEKEELMSKEERTPVESMANTPASLSSIPEIETGMGIDICKHVEKRMKEFEILEKQEVSGEGIVLVMKLPLKFIVKIVLPSSSEGAEDRIESVTFYDIAEDYMTMRRSKSAIFQNLSLRAQEVGRIFRDRYPGNARWRFLDYLSSFTQLFESPCARCGNHLFYDSQRFGLLPPTVFSLSNGAAYHPHCHDKMEANT